MCNMLISLGLERKRHYFFDVSFKNPNFSHTLSPDNCITSIATTLCHSRSLLVRAWVSFPLFCLFESDFLNLYFAGTFSIQDFVQWKAWNLYLQITGSEGGIEKDKFPGKVPTPSSGVTGTGPGWSWPK